MQPHIFVVVGVSPCGIAFWALARFPVGATQEHVLYPAKLSAAPRYWTWAALMRRAFDLDVLRCPRCAGRMQLIATIDDPVVIQRILAHLGLPGTRDGPSFPSAVSTAPAEQPALPSLTP